MINQADNLNEKKKKKYLTWEMLTTAKKSKISPHFLLENLEEPTVLSRKLLGNGNFHFLLGNYVELCPFLQNFSYRTLCEI